MKKFQNLFAYGLLTGAILLFAGCGTDSSTGGGSGDAGSGSETPAASEEGSGTAGGSDTSSTTVTTGDMQLVSLNVPNMT